MNKEKIKSFLTPKTIVIVTAAIVITMYISGELYLNSQLSKIAEVHNGNPKQEPEKFSLLVEQYSLLESKVIQTGVWVGKSCGSEKCNLNPDNYLKHTLTITVDRASLTYEIFRKDKLIYNSSIYGYSQYEGQTLTLKEPGGAKGLLYDYFRIPFSIKNDNEIKVWVGADGPILLHYEGATERQPAKKRNPLKIETAKADSISCQQSVVNCKKEEGGNE